MWNSPAFSLSPLPRIVFGDGTLAQVPALAAGIGKQALIVTGAHSFCAGPHWATLTAELTRLGVTWSHTRIANEPSPELIDQEVARCRAQGQAINVVIGIGGGSVLDAGKAIAGLLSSGDSVMDYLEGVGRGRAYAGPCIPYIAVPTTAGTGSEATKNAVLSVSGANGYKKSFRDDQLIPRYAVVDPQLLAGAPREQFAANGMDAFTQLLESYVSTNANPMMDALALSGLDALKKSFFTALDGHDGADMHHARAGMAYAALLSGITLAQVGLGSVHGIASPLGAFFPIPHGVACGTLVATATDVNIRALQSRLPESPALHKYARVGRMLADDPHLDDDSARAELVEILLEWEHRTDMPVLARYGVTAEDIGRIASNSRGNSMKTNPIVLTDDEIAEILRARLS